MAYEREFDEQDELQRQMGAQPQKTPHQAWQDSNPFGYTDKPTQTMAGFDPSIEANKGVMAGFDPSVAQKEAGPYAPGPNTTGMAKLQPEPLGPRNTGVTGGGAPHLGIGGDLGNMGVETRRPDGRLEVLMPRAGGPQPPNPTREAFYAAGRGEDYEYHSRPVTPDGRTQASIDLEAKHAGKAQMAPSQFGNLADGTPLGPDGKPVSATPGAGNRAAAAQSSRDAGFTDIEGTDPLKTGNYSSPVRETAQRW